jgi:Fe-S cluster assembly protein SufB
MATTDEEVNELVKREYEHGFVTEIESDTFEPGLNEDVIARLSGLKKEPEWMLEWRLKAYRRWLEMDEPNWASPCTSVNSWQAWRSMPFLTQFQ